MCWSIKPMTKDKTQFIYLKLHFDLFAKRLHIHDNLSRLTAIGLDHSPKSRIPLLSLTIHLTFYTKSFILTGTN